MLKNTVYLTKHKLRLSQFNITANKCRRLKDKSIVLGKDGLINSATLKGIIEKSKLQATDLISCLFRYQVGLRFFSFPSRDKQEISSMVNYEAQELLPLKPDETITRHLVLNTTQDGYSDTLVVSTQKSEVSSLFEKFKTAELKIASLNLSSLGIYSCIKNSILAEKKTVAKTDYMVVYAEDELLEIVIISNGQLVFSRGFMTDTEGFFSILTNEVQRSLDLFFDERKQTKLEKIIVSGRDTDLGKIAASLKDKFEFPVQIDRKIDLAYGLAIADKTLMNLLSDEFITTKIWMRLKKKLLFSVALIVLNIIFLAAVFFVVLNNKKEYLNKIEKELSRLRPQASSIQNKLRKIKMITMQRNSQILILEAISDLVKVTPSGCTLNMLSINEEGTLIVRGQARNLEEVFGFVVELEKSSYFKNSHLNYSSRRKIKTEEILDFEIQAQLNKE